MTAVAAAEAATITPLSGDTRRQISRALQAAATHGPEPWAAWLTGALRGQLQGAHAALQAGALGEVRYELRRSLTIRRCMAGQQCPSSGIYGQAADTFAAAARAAVECWDVAAAAGEPTTDGLDELRSVLDLAARVGRELDASTGWLLVIGPLGRVTRG
jgi:hypothetical protein